MITFLLQQNITQTCKNITQTCKNV